MKQFFTGIVLFLISILILPFAFVWGLIESVIGLFYKKRFFKALSLFGNLFKTFAILIDMLVNVLLQFPANRWLQKNGYKFGSYKNTISYALGINEREKTLTKAGLKLVAFLNFIDTDHCKNAIKE